jgi:hypothetical protein
MTALWAKVATRPLLAHSAEAAHLPPQVLMALHDTNSDIRRRDSCHELAWTLDACINRGMLAAEHLARLQVGRRPAGARQCCR